MIEELNYLKDNWRNSDAMKQTASVQLVHMIEANINQFDLLINWITEQKDAAVKNRVPYFVPTEFGQHDAFGSEMQKWFSSVTAISTLFFSVFMTSRSACDNMYRLYLEKTQPKSKWGRFTSIKDGLKKDEFKSLFDDFEKFETNFNRMRWIRNCYKSGAYCSSGGINEQGQLFVSLLMTEKDDKVVDTNSRISETDINTAILVCSETLDIIINCN